MRNLLKSQSGLSLIEIIVGSLILGIGVAAVMSFSTMISQAKTQVDSSLAIVNYRATIISMLRSSDAFARSAAGNSCLLNRTGCGTTSTAYAALSVLDEAGNQVTGTGATFGFSRNLRTCNSYPSEACPFRFNVEWRVLCQGAACDSPQLMARGTLTVDPADKSNVRTGKYNFEIALGQIIGTYEQSCQSLGGNYVPGEPPRCDMPIVGNCPAGMRVTGISAGPPASKICKPLVWSITPCAVGTQVMVGIRPDGTADCRNLRPTNPAVCVTPDDPSCPPWFCQQNPCVGSCPCPGPPAFDWGASSGDGGCGDGGC